MHELTLQHFTSQFMWPEFQEDPETLPGVYFPASKWYVSLYTFCGALLQSSD